MLKDEAAQVDAAIQILVKAGAYTKSLSRQFQQGSSAWKQLHVPNN